MLTNRLYLLPDYLRRIITAQKNSRSILDDPLRVPRRLCYNPFVPNTKQKQSALKVETSSVVPDRTSPIRLVFASPDADPASAPLGHETAFTEALCRKIEAGVTDRRAAGFDENVKGWRKQYDAEKQNRPIPWVGSADLEPPQTRGITDTIIAHLYKALCGVAPYFKLRPDDPDDKPVCTRLETALQSIFTGRIPLATLVRQMLTMATIDGTVIACPSWHVRVTKKRSVEQVTQGLIETLAAKVQAGGDGAEQAGAVLSQLQSVPLGEWRVIAREETTYDDAVIDIVDIRDFGMYPADARKVGAVGDELGLIDAPLQFVRTWHTRDALLHGVKSGHFDKDAVEGLLDVSPSASGRDDDEGGGDSDRAAAAGLPTSQTGSTLGTDDKPYECFKGLYQCDADDDGLTEWVLFEVAVKERVLLRGELYPYFHDKPFFIPVSVYPRRDYVYGYSTCEILHDLQEEQSVIRNQRVDNGTLVNTPTFAVKIGTKWDVQKDPFVPGSAYPVRDKDDITPILLGRVDQSAFAEEEKVVREMREVIGVSETLQGQTAGNTTLGETELARQGTNTKFDVLIDNVASALVLIASQVLALYGQYAADSTEFSADGSDGAPGLATFALSREEMRTPVRLSVRGTSSLMNRALQAQMGEKLLMFGERSPFVKDNLVRLHAVTARFLEGMGISDYESLIGTVDEAKQKAEAMRNAPPSPPETRVSVTERRDEVLTLGLSVKRGEITPDEYISAAQLAARANLQLPPATDPTWTASRTDSVAGGGTGGR